MKFGGGGTLEIDQLQSEDAHTQREDNKMETGKSERGSIFRARNRNAIKR